MSSFIEIKNLFNNRNLTNAEVDIVHNKSNVAYEVTQYPGLSELDSTQNRIVLICVLLILICKALVDVKQVLSRYFAGKVCTFNLVMQ